MKKFILTITLLMAFSLGLSAQQTYALVTGVSSYQDSEMNLGNTTKDAKDLKRVLDHLGVKSALLTSRYANNNNITEKLEKIVATAKPDDTIMFFFSGHGSTGVFCTYDGTFSYINLVNILSKAKAKQVYCFIDACRSGSVQNISNEGYNWAENRNITFFMGCRPDEFSFENGWVGNGLFSKALLKGLRGKASAGGSITVRSLFDYIYKDVTAHTHNYEQVQHPQLIGPKTMHQNVLFKR